MHVVHINENEGTMAFSSNKHNFYLLHSALLPSTQHICSITLPNLQGCTRYQTPPYRRTLRMRTAILAIPRILVVFFLVVLDFFVTLVVHSLLQKFLNSCCTPQMCLCRISCTWFYPEISEVMLHVSNNAFSVLLRSR